MPYKPYICRLPVDIQEGLRHLLPMLSSHCSSREVKQTHNSRPASQVIYCFTCFRNILLAAGPSAIAVTTQYAAEHTSVARQVQYTCMCSAGLQQDPLSYCFMVLCIQLNI